MIIQYLGTAAAEGAPALFCRCAFCQYARQTGGREIRTRSGALVDGVLKIDFGPDSYKQELDNGLDYTDIHSILVTHSHADHLDVSDVSYRRPGFAHVNEDEPPMTLYGNDKVGEKLSGIHSDWIAYRHVTPFQAFEVEGYAVTALEAVHCISKETPMQWPVEYHGKTYGRSEEALIYLIEKDGKSILYAHDTDELTLTNMSFLAGRQLDLVSLDCTNGRLAVDYIGHMGIREDLLMREKLLENGAADEHTVFVANHFSHNGLLPFGELERRLPGFLVAYDGMSVEV